MPLRIGGAVMVWPPGTESELHQLFQAGDIVTLKAGAGRHLMRVASREGRRTLCAWLLNGVTMSAYYDAVYLELVPVELAESPEAFRARLRGAAIETAAREYLHAELVDAASTAMTNDQDWAERRKARDAARFELQRALGTSAAEVVSASPNTAAAGGIQRPAGETVQQVAQRAPRPWRRSRAQLIREPAGTNATCVECPTCFEPACGDAHCEGSHRARIEAAKIVTVARQRQREHDAAELERRAEVEDDSPEFAGSRAIGRALRAAATAIRTPEQTWTSPDFDL